MGFGRIEDANIQLVPQLTFAAVPMRRDL